jgi:hypothetical protein
MKSGSNQYLEKVNLRPYGDNQALSVPLDWFDANNREVPRAMLVAVKDGVAEPDFYTSLAVKPYKTEVRVGEAFTIEGTADESHGGRSIGLTIDDQIQTTAPAVQQDGSWKLQFRFRQPGNRVMSLTVGGERVNLNIMVLPEVDDRQFTLSASVGRGGSNRLNDVIAVKQRLVMLGFNGLQVNGAVDTATINAIRLFQAIIAGRSRVQGVDGRVDVNGFTHTWLQAENAPGWQLMPLQGEGFFNHERQDENDNHDYGTSWMAEVLINAGKSYEASYRSTHPQAARIVINDVSLPHGGDSPSHGSHETGLSCDLLLPILPEKDVRQWEYGTNWRNDDYDRDAMRAMLQAFWRQPLLKLILFSDEVLIREGLCSEWPGHDHHAHFELHVPQRQG